MDSEPDIRAAVAAAWERVLGRPVPADVGFFQAGGDSLLLLKVHALVEEALGREIPLLDLVEHPTIAGLAAALAGTAPA